MKKIRIGSRESKLAIVQSEIFINELKRHYPDYEYVLVPMKTAGDRILDKPLDSIGGKGLFVKELDKALLEDRIDMAVHSLKDMPAELTPGLCIRAYSPREDPRDALVLPRGADRPDPTKPIGCTSRRRKLQLQGLYPDWAVADLRGNVLTRLEKLDRQEYGAVVLAVSGLKRLGLAHRIHRFFDPAEILPSAGQGTLIAVTRRDRDFAYLDAVDDRESRLCSIGERSFVKTLEGGCGAPIAAYGVIAEGLMTLTGFFSPEDGKPSVRGCITGPAEAAERLGKTLAFQLLGTYHRKTGGRGKVWLVGAGPGDLGLLTLKGDQVLRQAEIVLFDHLVGKGVLARIPPEAELLYVGKQAGRHAVPQESINSLLAKEAALGKRVVRLKGGDPFVFGRGGEELEGLNAAGLPFEVVPGVSSVFAAPAYCGIPVSHRDYCSQIHIITGHRKASSLYEQALYEQDGTRKAEETSAGEKGINYKALAESGGTLIFLMGLGSLKEICRGLLDAGVGPNTPGAVIEQGTTAKQRKVSAVLADLAEASQNAGLAAPAVIVIGEVCSLADRLAGAESKPLAGIRIGVTAPRRSGSRLAELFREAGAEVLEIPTIQIRPIPETPELQALLGSLTGQEWFGFTSPAGVEVFFDKLKAYRQDVRSLGGVKFAGVGRATSQALRDRGILADFVPAEFSGGELGTGLAKIVKPEERVILPRSRRGGEAILSALRAAGLDVLDLPIYDTAPLDPYRSGVLRELLLEGLDWLAFTSASGVEGFAEIFGTEALHNRKALCIGDQTAQGASQYGLEIFKADQPGLDSMVETLIRLNKKIG